MNSRSPCLEFIRIAKECRNILIEDTIGSESPDLYDALYSNSKSQIHKLKLELYEIKWMELHWEKISDVIENSLCSTSEKKEFISMVAKWYRDFISNWNYTAFEADIIEKKKDALNVFISLDNEWERSLKKMKVLFERDKNILNSKIAELEKEEC